MGIPTSPRDGLAGHYEVSFTRRVPVVHREQYINDCCIWFRNGNVRLAIDVFTDDPEAGAFRVHLTSRTWRLLVLDTVVDTPDLEELRTLVASELAAWVGCEVRVTRLDRKYSARNDDV